MSIQHTLQLHYRPRSSSLLTGLVTSGRMLRQKVVLAVLQWQTERVLSTLDRSILEDIGVPHDNVSPLAGPLERYPSVIRPNTSSILP